jgi:hypothetical protein
MKNPIMLKPRPIKFSIPGLIKINEEEMESREEETGSRKHLKIACMFNLSTLKKTVISIVLTYVALYRLRNNNNKS